MHSFLIKPHDRPLDSTKTQNKIEAALRTAVPIAFASGFGAFGAASRGLRPCHRALDGRIYRAPGSRGVLGAVTTSQTMKKSEAVMKM
jgi:hypothetical protein